MVVQNPAGMPEEKPAHLIGRRLHIKDHAHTFFLSGTAVGEFQHNGTGEILIPQILGFIVVADIDHAPQIFDQCPVRIIGGRLIKESPPLSIGLQHDLKGIDHRGFPAS